MERKESSEKASSARESALRIALQDSDESKLAMSAVLDVASNSKHSLKSRAAQEEMLHAVLKVLE